MRTKAIVVRGILNLQESALHEHLWDIGRCLSEPDSMLAANARIIARSRHAAGSFITFRPYFYPQKGRLFEPYAYREGEEIRVAELGGSGEHDYTRPLHHGGRRWQAAAGVAGSLPLLTVESPDLRYVYTVCHTPR